MLKFTSSTTTTIESLTHNESSSPKHHEPSSASLQTFKPLIHCNFMTPATLPLESKSDYEDIKVQLDMNQLKTHIFPKNFVQCSTEILFTLVKSKYNEQYFLQKSESGKLSAKNGSHPYVVLDNPPRLVFGDSNHGFISRLSPYVLLAGWLTLRDGILTDINDHSGGYHFNLTGENNFQYNKNKAQELLRQLLGLSLEDFNKIFFQIDPNIDPENPIEQKAKTGITHSVSQGIPDTIQREIKEHNDKLDPKIQMELADEMRSKMIPLYEEFTGQKWIPHKKIAQKPMSATLIQVNSTPKQPETSPTTVLNTASTKNKRTMCVIL